MASHLTCSYLKGESRWLRGQLHTHSTGSDGTRPPEVLFDDYSARGYDFVMVSDHDRLTLTDQYRNSGIVLIPGNEISANGPHVLHVNAGKVIAPEADRQSVLDAVGEDVGSFAIMAHPNWLSDFNHCPQERLEALHGYAGIEIYNGVIRRLPGSPNATDRWDRLLGAGRRVWGFANDDSHKEFDVELAWNMVQLPAGTETSVDSVVAALSAGSFYASTGVKIDRIAVTGSFIHVTASNAHRILAVVDFGKVIAQADGNALHYRVPDAPDFSYVRIECYGAGEAMAWMQPVFVDVDDPAH